MRTAVHLYYSPFQFESRAERAANAALDAGLVDRVVFLGHVQSGLPRRQPLSEGIEVHRAGLSGVRGRFLRLLSWPFWIVHAIWLIGRYRPTFLQCHSLAALVPAALARLLLGVVLIYDAHELESDRAGWSPGLKRAAFLLERLLIGRADAVLVVSASIRDWYERAYPGLPLFLVRNITNPPADDARGADSGDGLRQALGIDQDQIVHVYAGALGYGRGTDSLLRAFSAVEASRHLVFVGYGEHEAMIRAAAGEHANIHWHPPVPHRQLIGFLAGADVGLCLIDDVCLSYRYCLPNKLFEYRFAGLPVIVSALPELSAFVEQHACGWTVETEGDDLAALVDGLDRPQIEAMAAGAATPPTWADEEVRYLQAVTSVLERRKG